MRLADRDNLTTLGVFLFALALMFFFVTHSQVDNPIRADAKQYFFIAYNLVTQHVYSMSDPGGLLVPDGYRPPGYPWFLALMMAICTHPAAWYQSVVLVQAVMTAVVAALTFRIARQWLPYWPSLLVATMVALWPGTVLQIDLLLTETLFTFLLTLALWFQCGMLRHRFWLWLCMSALAYAAAALVNPILLPLIVGVAVLVGVQSHRKLAATAFLLIALCPSVLWQLRNNALPPGPNSETSRLVTNFVQGMDPAIRQYYVDRSSPAAQRTYAQFGEMLALYQRDPAAFFQSIKQRFMEAPGYYARIYLLQKPRQVWDWVESQGLEGLYVYPFVLSPYRSNAIFAVSGMVVITLESVSLYTLVPIGLMLGTWLLYRSREVLLPGTLVLCFVYITALYALLMPDARYTVPFRGIEFILAMAGMCWLVELARKHLRSQSQPEI